MTPTDAEKYFGFILLKMITNENENRFGLYKKNSIEFHF
jgi:hypothetical protein